MNKNEALKRIKAQESAMLREQALEGGWYGKAKVQVHTNPKAYRRTPKHKKGYDVN